MRLSFIRWLPVGVVILVWGMTFAFLSVALFVGLTAWALYLDHPWFAGISAFASLITIVSIFVDTGRNGKKK